MLQELGERARRVREQANDSKLAALRSCLQQAQFAELKDGRGKLLVFTEHRDTMNHVRDHIQRWGYTTCEIHGGMNVHERKRAQEAFRTQAQVCVATEAAGEGINLQFCHLMINYDLPWNPTRLEQRLGRIHRIGQDRDVYVFNFVATDSETGQPIIEGRILHRLLEKLDQMSEALGGRVFDVIGEVLSLNDVNLPEILREAAYDPRRLEDYINQLDRLDPNRLAEYERATGIALARGFVDFTGFQRRNLEIEERRLMPRYVEDHFVTAAREVRLRVEPRADGLWRVEHVLAELRSDRLQSAARVGKADASYRKLTFHKEQLEQDAHLDAVLLGPGHPLYAAVEERLQERWHPRSAGPASTSTPWRRHPTDCTFSRSAFAARTAAATMFRCTVSWSRCARTPAGSPSFPQMCCSTCRPIRARRNPSPRSTCNRPPTSCAAPTSWRGGRGVSKNANTTLAWCASTWKSRSMRGSARRQRGR